MASSDHQSVPQSRAAGPGHHMVAGDEGERDNNQDDAEKKEEHTTYLIFT